MPRRPIVRPLVAAALIIAAASAWGCRKDAPADASVPPVVGDWVRVYPPAGALDTFRLAADGSVHGSRAGFGTADFELVSWKIGDPLMPGGLCLGNGERQWCQGFRVRNDTLVLGNALSSVFVRVSSTGPPATIMTSGAQPSAAAAPPRDGVRPVYPPDP